MMPLFGKKRVHYGQYKKQEVPLTIIPSIDGVKFNRNFDMLYWHNPPILHQQIRILLWKISENISLNIEEVDMLWQ